jgi:hypothetical protein
MQATDGQSYNLNQLTRLHAFTVVLFYSDTCPTVKAHDARVNALAAHYAPQVGFYWLDSEVGATVTRDQHSARLRGYSMPILIDEDARVADALGARFASHAFILRRGGAVAYSGGIDSDKRTLHADATPYLGNALNALLHGATPRQSDHRALGCALNR